MIFFELISQGYVPPANYFKSEIRELLNLSPNAWKSMVKTAKNNGKDLLKELEKTGYKTSQQRLTKLQSKLVFEFLGYPDLSEKNKGMLIKNKYLTQKDIDNAEDYIK